MTDKRKAVVLAALAILSLLVGALFGGMFPRAGAILVVAGFLGYVLAGRAALALLRVDEMIFEDSRRSRRASRSRSADEGASRGASAVAAGLVIGALNSVALGQAASSTDGPRAISEGKRDLGVSPRRSDPRVVLFRHRKGPVDSANR